MHGRKLGPVLMAKTAEDLLNLNEGDFFDMPQHLYLLALEKNIGLLFSPGLDSLWRHAQFTIS